MTFRRLSHEAASKVVHEGVVETDVAAGIHVLESANRLAAAANIRDMGDGMMGFDGGNGYVTWDATSILKSSADGCYYWLFLQYTSHDSRPLNVWGEDTSSQSVLLAENVALETTGAWDPSGLQWFHYGPLEIPPDCERIKIDSVNQGFWPHVQRLVLLPAVIEAFDSTVQPTRIVATKSTNSTDDATPTKDKATTSPCLQKPSHPGVKAQLESIPVRKAALQKTRPVAVLREPHEKTPNVRVNDDMIFVDGNGGGWYSFAFDNTGTTSCKEAFIDITYASGDPRPITLTINETFSRDGCCSDVTGGYYGADNFVHRRYGPFPLQEQQSNTVKISTNQGCYFPHIGEIRVVDASKSLAVTTTRNSKTWIVPPSQEPSEEIRQSLGFCFGENTQEPNPHFQPDPSFYNGICIDGLWVLASKQVDKGILNCAAELVSRYVPIEIRKLCLQWRAPLDMPQGPFRLIILDAATNQQAGNCPEFPDCWTGRNSTINPGVFTSSDDFRLSGNGNGNQQYYYGGELTVHELTHGLDLVIRQQLDPYFMQQVEDCFQQGRLVYHKSYAAANRHEYLAEICMLFVGTNPHNFLRGCCQCGQSETGYCDFEHHNQFASGKAGVNFRRKSDLIQNDPGGYRLLKSFLMEIHDSDKFCEEEMNDTGILAYRGLAAGANLAKMLSKNQTKASQKDLLVDIESSASFSGSESRSQLEDDQERKPKKPTTIPRDYLLQRGASRGHCFPADKVCAGVHGVLGQGIVGAPEIENFCHDGSSREDAIVALRTLVYGIRKGATGLKNLPQNAVPVPSDHGGDFDRDSNWLIVPCMTLQQAREWKGDDYWALAICGNKPGHVSRNLADIDETTEADAYQEAYNQSADNEIFESLLRGNVHEETLYLDRCEEQHIRNATSLLSDCVKAIADVVNRDDLPPDIPKNTGNASIRAMTMQERSLQTPNIRERVPSHHQSYYTSFQASKTNATSARAKGFYLKDATGTGTVEVPTMPESLNLSKVVAVKVHVRKIQGIDGIVDPLMLAIKAAVN
ncbi:expressed unknown protein [Seminavis robusta]|uniref:Uncharacterized protein n=1 Tax=Seminavis robusta TaxID=568900 RepID=A0A9N8E4C5_9STRA|nr:expressed unknown protein [Seminavis robusta]|eukprot:Sro509_g157130.1 n/a (1029) ;mRNA; f:54232-57417